MHLFQIDMTAEGKEPLCDALWMVLKIANCEGRDQRGKKRGITHYAILPAFAGVQREGGGWEYGQEPRPVRLVFYNYHTMPPPGGSLIGYPFTLDPDGVADFARRWLEEVEYGREHDTDGHCEKGWRVHNGRGHMGDDWHAVIAVSPAWIIYGK